jgi:hypothetical protein
MLPEGQPAGSLRIGPVSIRDSLRGGIRGGFAGVRRLDSTADLRFDSSAEGLAFMAGVAALGLPRGKQAIWRAGDGTFEPKHQDAQREAWRHGNGELDEAPMYGRAAVPRAIETVAFYGHSGKKMLARVYDKGVEAGLAPRGRLLRPENQDRFVKDTRRDVAELTTGYVKERFAKRFRPLWQASKGVTVAGAPVLIEKVYDLVDQGVITPAAAEALSGFAMAQSSGRWVGSRATYYRRRRQLREHGIVLPDLGLDEVEVNLHDILAEVFETDAWERRG